MMAHAPWRLTVDYQRESVVFRLPDGTPVHTHYSFGLIALLLTAPLLLRGQPAHMIIGALLMGMMHLSILAHELGHKAAAQRQGARTTEIEIGLFGGLARLEWDHHGGVAIRPVALAGPAVSLGLAGVFFALYWVTVRYGAPDAQTYYAQFDPPAILSRTVYLAFLLNLWLGLFNLLPAYPLDGGTVAEDLLGERLGVRRARLIVGICGVVVAVFSLMVMFVMAMAGMPLLVFASLRANWEAVKSSWAARPKSIPSQRTAERVTSVVQFKKRGGNS
jgi:Zn-dependent protease